MPWRVLFCLPIALAGSFSLAAPASASQAADPHPDPPVLARVALLPAIPAGDGQDLPHDLAAAHPEPLIERVRLVRHPPGRAGDNGLRHHAVRPRFARPDLHPALGRRSRVWHPPGLSRQPVPPSGVKAPPAKLKPGQKAPGARR